MTQPAQLLLARTFDAGSSVSSNENSVRSIETEVEQVAFRALPFDPDQEIGPIPPEIIPFDPNQGIGPIPPEIRRAALDGRISPGTLDALVRANTESFRQYIAELNRQT